ncbi:hypothetical protein GCM10008955_40690 [Deinococcus malanensis]|uniref:DUF4198 domain-containing protein n=1 Tax=Deinococcus malanensis TaxID=1706855 RepID=A0ABQ2F5T5_9DEIO|nr:hypothetical protein [Deinococcus malanensis]GGK42761.1 hypothetical protein GCM10008955_40690 [Deinococcus malanensis]
MKSTILTALTLSLLGVAAAHAGHDATGALTFSLSEPSASKFTVAGPAQVAQGFTTVILENTSKQAFTPVLAQLKNGATDAQVKAALGKLMQSRGEDMSAILNLADFVGGTASLAPGATFEYGTSLRSGKYVLFGFGATEEGKPFYDLGQYKTFTVTTAKNGAAVPKADVKATLKDFKVELPKTVKAGKQLWEISNAGQETHHLMLMRLNDGKTMKDVEAFFKAPDPSQAGAPPFEDVGGLETLSKGRKAFTSFDLKPGEYLVVCFLPSAKQHAPHFALGMISTVSVK